MRFERAATRHALGWETARVTRLRAGADEPYERIVHVRICGGRRRQLRLLPGTEWRFRWRSTAIGPLHVERTRFAGGGFKFRGGMRVSLANWSCYENNSITSAVH